MSDTPFELPKQTLGELLSRCPQPLGSFGCEGLPLPPSVVALSGVEKGYGSFVLNGPPDKLCDRFALSLAGGGTLVAILQAPRSRGLRGLLTRQAEREVDMAPWCDAMLAAGLREIRATQCDGFTVVCGRQRSKP